MTRRSPSDEIDRRRRSRSKDRHKKRKKESKSKHRSRTPVKKSRRRSRSKSRSPRHRRRSDSRSPIRSKRRSSSRSPSRSYSKDTQRSSRRSSSGERNRSESRAKEGVYPRKLPTRRSRSRTRTPEKPKPVPMPDIELNPILLSSATNKSAAITAIESSSFIQSAFKSERNVNSSTLSSSSTSILNRNPLGNTAYAQFKREQDHERAIFGKSSSPLTVTSLTDDQEVDQNPTCVSILELEDNVIHPRLKKNMEESWKKWAHKLMVLREQVVHS